MYPNLTVYDGPMDVEIYVSRFLEYLYIDNISAVSYNIKFVKLRKKRASPILIQSIQFECSFRTNGG